MAEDKKKILTGLISGSITKDEFLSLYARSTKINKDYILQLLNHASNNHDPAEVEAAIVIGCAFNCFVKGHSEVLGDLIQQSWHVKHEDMALILEDLKEPSTVDSLFKAAQLHLEYLEYDDTYQFARKCIKALSRINTKEAISKLQLLAQNNIPEIKQYAVKELKYKGIL